MNKPYYLFNTTTSSRTITYIIIVTDLHVLICIILENNNAMPVVPMPMWV